MSSPKPLEVQLVTHTQSPVGTLYYLWAQSRSHELPYDARYYEGLVMGHGDPAHEVPHMGKRATQAEIRAEVLQVVKQLIEEDWPILQNIHFTFAIRNLPMSLREQLIRHKVGVSLGDNVGFDTIPERGGSAFWSQTMRMVPMDNFYDDGRFIIPESIATAGMMNVQYTGLQGEQYTDIADADVLYQQFLSSAQSLYRTLIANGVPMEDARQVLPVGATSSLTWTLSLQAIKSILGKRACWIAQYGLWGNIITQMGAHLRNGVHSLFGRLVSPPCSEKGKWVGCPVALVNQDRMDGVEDQPPCPLWALHEKHGYSSKSWAIADDMTLYNPINSHQYRLEQMSKQFEELWGINPTTGEYLYGE